MLKTNFYINGIKIKEPINYRELSIELNFDTDDPSFTGEVSTNSWEIGLGDGLSGVDGAKIINDYINQGLTGGKGIFEGISFRIELVDGPAVQDLFNGYLDLSEAEVLCDRVTAKAVETGKIDWLNEVADSFTFEYLFSGIDTGVPGKITQDDFILVPYIISTIPDTREILFIILAEFVLVREGIQIVREIEEFGSALASDILTFGNIFALLIAVIQLFLLIIILITLIVRMLNLIIQPVKYFGSMLLRDLCIKGCEYLGLEFESTILNNDPWNKVAVIPQTFEAFENDRLDSGNSILNNLQQSLIPELFFGLTDPRKGDVLGFYRGTFGQLLRQLKTMFNAKIIFDGKILRLERIDFDPSNNLFQLPDLDRSKVSTRFNFQDFKSYFSLSFTPDLNDKNVWLDYEGTEIQVITAPKQFENQLNILTKGESINKLEFALSSIKTKLTIVEIWVKNMAINVDRLIGRVEKSTNKVIKVVNRLLKPIKKIIKALKVVGIKVGGSNLLTVPPVKFRFSLVQSLNIDGRLNMMSIENDFINLPKLVLLNTDTSSAELKSVRLRSDLRDILNAEFLYDNFYAINSFVGDNPNQYKIFTLTDVPFCIDDYNKVKNSKFVIESDGIRKGEIITLKWNVYQQRAIITYRVREKYTDNLKETKILSDGR